MSLKNSNGTIGNRTRDLPACGAVPQPTATPGTPYVWRNAAHCVLEYFSLTACGVYSRGKKIIFSFCGFIQVLWNETRRHFSPTISGLTSAMKFVTCQKKNKFYFTAQRDSKKGQTHFFPAWSPLNILYVSSTIILYTSPYFLNWTFRVNVIELNSLCEWFVTWQVSLMRSC